MTAFTRCWVSSIWIHTQCLISSLRFGRICVIIQFPHSWATLICYPSVIYFYFIIFFIFQKFHIIVMRSYRKSLMCLRQKYHVIDRRRTTRINKTKVLCCSNERQREHRSCTAHFWSTRTERAYGENYNRMKMKNAEQHFSNTISIHHRYQP